MLTDRLGVVGSHAPGERQSDKEREQKQEERTDGAEFLFHGCGFFEFVITFVFCFAASGDKLFSDFAWYKESKWRRHSKIF